jgi:hypothetical protein
MIQFIRHVYPDWADCGMPARFAHDDENASRSTVQTGLQSQRQPEENFS